MFQKKNYLRNSLLNFRGALKKAEIIPANLNRIMPAKGVKPIRIPVVQHNYFIMKKIMCLNIAIYISLTSLAQDTTLLTPVEVTAVRATEIAPVVKTNMNKVDIAARNTGQDIPYILQYTPGLLAFSDAGNGIGYTGLRIRGSDASRINFTINGIPYNDAESQGTFLVNIPDIASSTGSIQVQRGVGTTSQGTGSFGGGVHISTNEIDKEPSVVLSNTFGSYGSMKNTLLLNSGLYKKKFLADIRLSNVQSNGYIDRAETDLGSIYAALAWMNEKNSVRFNFIHGKERTYQAWNGVDETTLKDNRTYNSAGTEKPGTPYENEVDNYRQTHYQLFYNRTISNKWRANLTLFLTRGKGYYEQYKAEQTLAEYGIDGITNEPDPVLVSDLVRRLYLDNYYYGSVFSFQHKITKRDVTLGGGVYQYDGDHYGKVIRLITPEQKFDHNWYNNTAYKTDASVYGKWTEKITPKLYTFVDIQLRSVDYTIHGFRNAPQVNQENNFLFLNPKIGFTYRTGGSKIYFSVAKGSKEPNRDDFEASIDETPLAEHLYDFETGIEQTFKKGKVAANFYYMHYKDQLVLTGKINDVGAYTRTNIPKSYRVGIELEGAYAIHKKINVLSNISFSSNKIKNFTEYIDDYDNGGQIEYVYEKTNISFSPSVTGMWMIQYKPVKALTLELSGKFAGDQYLDNTSNKNRQLDAYYVQDVRVEYNFKLKGVKNIQAFAHVQNLFSSYYEPNGYTFSYVYGQSLITENYYFPMAPIQFFVGVNLKL